MSKEIKNKQWNQQDLSGQGFNDQANASVQFQDLVKKILKKQQVNNSGIIPGEDLYQDQSQKMLKQYSSSSSKNANPIQQDSKVRNIYYMRQVIQAQEIANMILNMYLDFNKQVKLVSIEELNPRDKLFQTIKEIVYSINEQVMNLQEELIKLQSQLPEQPYQEEIMDCIQIMQYKEDILNLLKKVEMSFNGKQVLQQHLKKNEQQYENSDKIPCIWRHEILDQHKASALYQKFTLELIIKNANLQLKCQYCPQKLLKNQISNVENKILFNLILDEQQRRIKEKQIKEQSILLYCFNSYCDYWVKLDNEQLWNGVKMYYCLKCEENSIDIKQLEYDNYKNDVKIKQIVKNLQA